MFIFGGQDEEGTALNDQYVLALGAADGSKKDKDGMICTFVYRRHSLLGDRGYGKTKINAWLRKDYGLQVGPKRHL